MKTLEDAAKELESSGQFEWFQPQKQTRTLKPQELKELWEIMSAVAIPDGLFAASVLRAQLGLDESELVKGLSDGSTT